MTAKKPAPAPKPKAAAKPKPKAVPANYEYVGTEPLTAVLPDGGGSLDLPPGAVISAADTDRFGPGFFTRPDFRLTSKKPTT